MLTKNGPKPGTKLASLPLFSGKKRPSPNGQQQQQQRKCFLIDSLLEERQKKLAAAAAAGANCGRNGNNGEDKDAERLSGMGIQTPLDLDDTELKMEEQQRRENGPETNEDVQMGEEQHHGENGDESLGEEALPSPCALDEQNQSPTAGGVVDGNDRKALLDALVKLLPVVQQQPHSNGGTVTTKVNSTVPTHSQPQQKEEQQQMAMAAATAAAASMEFLQRVRLFQQHLTTGNFRPNANGNMDSIFRPSSSSSATAITPQFPTFLPNFDQKSVPKSTTAPKPSPYSPMAALGWHQFLAAAASAGGAQTMGGQHFGGSAAQPRGMVVPSSSPLDLLLGRATAVGGNGGKRQTTAMDEANSFMNGNASPAAAMLASIGAFRAAAVAAAAMGGNKGSQQQQVNYGEKTTKTATTAKKTKLDLKEKLLLNHHTSMPRIAALTTGSATTSSGGSRSSNVKKYRCDICDKTFSRSNTLITHKRIHTGEKPFRCDHCGRAFRQPGNLTRHAYTHTTVKPFVCTECGKAFNRASNLQTHIRVHSLTAAAGAAVNSAEVGAHQCAKCQRRFGTRAELRAHKC